MSTPLAILAYLEGHLSGRRVVVFGRGAANVATQIVGLGARLVHAFDPDVKEAYDTLRPAPITVRPLDGAEAEVRAGAFDVAVVLDQADVEPLHRFLPRVRRIIAEDGILALVGGASGAGPNQEELYDLVSLQFESVQMLATFPFGGTAVALLGAEDPDVSVDTQFADEPTPEHYLVIASRDPVELDAYMIVQLPPEVATYAPASAPAREAELVLRARVLETALDEARAKLTDAARDRGAGPKVAELETELFAKEQRLEASEARARQHAATAQRLEVEVSRLQEVARENEREVREVRRLLEAAPAPGLLAELEQRAEKAEALRADLASQQNKSGEVSEQARLLGERLSAAQAELAQRHEQLAAAEAALGQRSVELAAAKAELEQRNAELGAAAEAYVPELGALEESLRAAGQRVRELERELGRRGALVEELVRFPLSNGANGYVVADQGGAAGPTDVSAAKLDRLARDLAEAHAELQSRQWKVEALEASQTAARIAALESELGSLRSAEPPAASTSHEEGSFPR